MRSKKKNSKWVLLAVIFGIVLALGLFFGNVNDADSHIKKLELNEEEAEVVKEALLDFPGSLYIKESSVQINVNQTYNFEVGIRNDNSEPIEFKLNVKNIDTLTEAETKAPSSQKLGSIGTMHYGKDTYYTLAVNEAIVLPIQYEANQAIPDTYMYSIEVIQRPIGSNDAGSLFARKPIFVTVT